MSDGTPSSVTLEDTYLIEADYTPEAVERRIPVRAEHLGRLAELMTTGTLIEAGAFKDLSGSLLLLRAESEAAARAIAEADVYVGAGVWGEIRVRPFNRVVPT